MKKAKLVSFEYNCSEQEFLSRISKAVFKSIIVPGDHILLKYKRKVVARAGLKRDKGKPVMCAYIPIWYTLYITKIKRQDLFDEFFKTLFKEDYKDIEGSQTFSIIFEDSELLQ